MEGPIDEHICALFQYTPFAPDGLFASTDFCKLQQQTINKSVPCKPSWQKKKKMKCTYIRWKGGQFWNILLQLASLQEGLLLRSQLFQMVCEQSQFYLLCTQLFPFWIRLLPEMHLIKIHFISKIIIGSSHIIIVTKICIYWDTFTQSMQFYPSVGTGLSPAMVIRVHYFLYFWSIW